MTTTNADLARIQEQFRRQAAAYERLVSVHDSESLGRLASLLELGGSERVLDVACGPAFLTMAIAARSREAVGLDGTDVFLSHARAEARRRAIDRVRFVLGDVERMPLADGAFDAVACRAAFHHFPRPDAVLREIVRVARPRARILIADMVSSEDAAKARLHDEIERLCDPTHAHALALSEFERLFESLRLSVAFRAETRIDYSVAEWMSHGGPPPERVVEIERLLRESIDGDRAALGVRVENGELRFRHTAVAFVVVTPA